MDVQEIEKLFTYHPPSPKQVETYEQIRLRFKELSLALNSLLPESREKARVIEHLQIANMLANASIALHS